MKEFWLSQSMGETTGYIETNGVIIPIGKIKQEDRLLVARVFNRTKDSAQFELGPDKNKFQVINEATEWVRGHMENKARWFEYFNMAWCLQNGNDILASYDENFNNVELGRIAKSGNKLGAWAGDKNQVFYFKDEEYQGVLAQAKEWVVRNIEVDK
jgi:hypothetical protein